MFTKYTHVQRITSEDAKGLLGKPAYLSAKLDGTNSSIWLVDNILHAGSRNREISTQKDNAGFCNWVVSNPNTSLIDFLKSFEKGTIVYGEWLGVNKPIGHIKYYKEDTLSTFHVFDVYSPTLNWYIPYPEWQPIAEKYNISYIPHDYVEEVTLDILQEYAEKASLPYLSDTTKQGEGVVVKNYDYTNKYGNHVYGKLVLADFLEQKSKSSKIALSNEDIYSNIVSYYMTDAELYKTKEKVLTIMNIPEFDNTNAQCIGRFISLCWNDLLEEMPDIVKRYHNPTINFATLRNVANTRSRSFLGLI